jgi:3-oxoacyl-[acyl-carrier-protein] synthase II
VSAALRGIGVVGAFGCGIAALEEALRRPRSDAFSPDAALTASTDLLDRMIPPRTLRRVEHYGRMAILAALLAVEDAGMAGAVPTDTGLVVATGMGPTANTLDLQASDIPLADLSLSPILFSNSVQNAAGAYISMLLGMRGPTLSINQYDLAVPLAFQAAVDWLDEGRTRTVLVGSVDGFSTALHGEALSGRSRDAAPVGEGSAFFVLTREGGSDARAMVAEILTGLGQLPSKDAPLLLNGHAGAEPGRTAGFADVYGVFPTSMGMDVASAALLLGSEPPLPARPDSGRVRCLKRCETGEWGTIVLARG